MAEIKEDIVPTTHAGRDLFMRNLRKVLVRRGYSGEALEAKIVELMQKDVSRLAAIITRPRQ